MKVLQTALGVLFLVVIPLLPKLELLHTWPIILTIIGGSMVHLHAPHTPLAELWENNPNDRYSTLLMVFATALFSLVSIVDHAYFLKIPYLTAPQFFEIGAGAILLGLLLRGWTIETLGKYFTARVTLEEEHEMVLVGPYKWLKIRHPAYTGTFFVCFGIALVLGSTLGLVAFFLLVVPTYIYRIHVEESALVKKLGDKYLSFCKQTYRLIPFVY